MLATDVLMTGNDTTTTGKRQFDMKKFIVTSNIISRSLMTSSGGCAIGSEFDGNDNNRKTNDLESSQPTTTQSIITNSTTTTTTTTTTTQNNGVSVSIDEEKGRSCDSVSSF